MAIALILLPMSNIKSCLECMNIDQAFKTLQEKLHFATFKMADCDC